MACRDTRPRTEPRFDRTLKVTFLGEMVNPYSAEHDDDDPSRTGGFSCVDDSEGAAIAAIIQILRRFYRFSLSLVIPSSHSKHHPPMISNEGHLAAHFPLQFVAVLELESCSCFLLPVFLSFLPAGFLQVFLLRHLNRNRHYIATQPQSRTCIGHKNSTRIKRVISADRSAIKR